MSISRIVFNVAVIAAVLLIGTESSAQSAAPAPQASIAKANTLAKIKQNGFVTTKQQKHPSVIRSTSVKKLLTPFG
jgi:hypothetical protein